jgi:signal transduction histidine kinase
MEAFTYDAAFTPIQPSAPRFPDDLKAAIADDTVASRWLHTDGRRLLLVAVRLEDETIPCRFVLSRRPAGTRDASLLVGGLAIAGTFLLAVLVAAGPVVRRIRRLTSDVRRSAADRYATPVGAQGRDEIGQLAQAFNEAGAELRSQLAQLEARERTLREFVANTTHDVMHPLTVLQGHLVALRRAIEAGEPPPRDVVLSAIEESHYLGSLLHNLGSAATLEAGTPGVQHLPVHLQPLLDRVIGRHRPVAALKNVELNDASPEPPLWVDGDVTLLEQAVGNLVQNAVRYNDAGGHVVVLLEEVRDGRFSLRVIDDGPGIPDEEIARLAERSYRGDAARQRNPDGLGLGLHIARDVATRHGFSFDIRRSEYGGLEVEIAGRLRSPGPPE